MRREVDVLCVGLGPAGARAAAAAAGRGLRVLGIDRKRRAGTPVQCAEFVPALLGVEVPGLPACVEQPIEAMDTFVEASPPHRTTPFPGGIIDRADFDTRLVVEAIHAGAHCRFGVNLRRLAPDGLATLSDGSEVRAQVVIGADGPRSAVGRAIGITNTQLIETRQVTVPLVRAHDATDIFLSCDIPGGYAWLFPKGRAANLGAGVDPEYIGRLKGIVERLHRRLVQERRVGEPVEATTGGAIPAGGPLLPHGVLGECLVLLAGDAAGLANPVTGAGIAAAVHSGTLAGTHAASHLAGRARAAQDYADELESLFGASLRRALGRRREQLWKRASTAAWRRSWIAFPEYWTGAMT